MALDTPQPATSPFGEHTDPTRAWAELRANSRTDEQRACVAAATRHTDRAWVALHEWRFGAESAAVPPRDTAWHRLALGAYELLSESGAYGHLAQRRPWACAAAEPVIGAWLNGPAGAGIGHGGDAVTVAQDLRVDDAFTRINGDTQADHLSTLINAAQDAHVFGVPGHRIELVRAAHHDTGTDTTLVRLVVDTPTGPALASDALHVGVLVDSDREGVDAATSALRRVADVVSGMFTDQARAVWDAPPPMPAPDRASTPAGRAFPELHLDQTPAPPASPTPAPSAAPYSPGVDSDNQGRSR